MTNEPGSLDRSRMADPPHKIKPLLSGNDSAALRKRKRSFD